jgi:hypothetical protein
MIDRCTISVFIALYTFRDGVCESSLSAFFSSFTTTISC